MNKIENNLNNKITTAIEYKKLMSICGDLQFTDPVCYNNTLICTNNFILVAAAATYTDPNYESARLNNDGAILNRLDPKKYAPLKMYKTVFFASESTPESFDCYAVTPNFRARCREALKAARIKSNPAPVRIGSRCFPSEKYSALYSLFQLTGPRVRTFLYICNVGDVRDGQKGHRFCYAVSYDAKDRPVAISALMPALSLDDLDVPIEGLTKVDRPLGDLSEILTDVENYYKK